MDEIFTADLTLMHNVKSMVKISSIFVAFLENMNFTYYYKALDKIWASRIYLGKFNFKFHY